MKSAFYMSFLVKLECSRQIFDKSWNIKFNENLFKVFPCGRTDMSKTVMVFCNVENAPENKSDLYPTVILYLSLHLYHSVTAKLNLFCRLVLLHEIVYHLDILYPNLSYILNPTKLALKCIFHNCIQILIIWHFAI